MEGEPRGIRLEAVLSVRPLEFCGIHGRHRIRYRVERKRIEISVVDADRTAGHPVRIRIRQFGIVRTPNVFFRYESRGIRHVESRENDQCPGRHHSRKRPHASVVPDRIRQEDESARHSDEEYVAVEPRRRKPVGDLVHRQPRERAPNHESHLRGKPNAQVPGVFVQHAVLYDRLASDEEDYEERDERRDGEFPISLFRVFGVRESFRADGGVSAERVFQLEQGESEEYEIDDRERDVRFPRSEIPRGFGTRGVQMRPADFGDEGVEESSENYRGNRDSNDSYGIQIGEIRPSERREPISYARKRRMEHEVARGKKQEIYEYERHRNEDPLDDFRRPQLLAAVIGIFRGILTGNLKIRERARPIGHEREGEGYDPQDFPGPDAFDGRP